MQKMIQVQDDMTHVPRRDFRLPYVTEGADNFLGGMSWIDLLTSGVYVAHLRFTNNTEYHVAASRRRLLGSWIVSLQPAE
jgi:hypothetical protein